MWMVQRHERILKNHRRLLSGNGQGQGGEGRNLGQGGLLVFSNKTSGSIYDLTEREFGCEQTFLRARKTRASLLRRLASARPGRCSATRIHDRPRTIRTVARRSERIAQNRSGETRAPMRRDRPREEQSEVRT